MKTAEKTSPPLTDEAREQAKRITSKFDDDLKGIAERLASSHSAEKILVPHINEALLALKRAGLRKPNHGLRFWEKPAFKVAIGTLFIGLAPAISSFSKDIIQSGGGTVDDHPFAFWICMIVIPGLAVSVGIGTAIYGWVQGESWGKSIDAPE